MQKDPLERYLTVQSLIADIQKVREGIRSNTSLDWSPLKAPEESPALPKESKPRATRREKPAEREREAPSGPSVSLLAGLGIFAVLMVAGFAFFMSTLLFGNPFNGGPREANVPANLIGMQQQQAIDALKAAGLTADVRSDFSDKPEGVVYDSTPKSGMEMRTGRPVILFVSKGTEPITVPDVVGKKRAEAQQALQSAGLVMSDTKTEFSEIYEKGEVIAQSPIGGTQAKKKSPVTLIVSKGAEPVPGNEPVAVETPDTAPPETHPDTPAEPAPQGEMPVREHEVSIRVPRSAKSAQTVKIVVRNEDGSEQTVYEQEHQPGEDVKQTVSTLGNKGKCQIRVYLNDHEISRTDV
jgi:hypothetical protein